MRVYVYIYIYSLLQGTGSLHTYVFFPHIFPLLFTQREHSRTRSLLRSYSLNYALLLLTAFIQVITSNFFFSPSIFISVRFFSLFLSTCPPIYFFFRTFTHVPTAWYFFSIYIFFRKFEFVPQPLYRCTLL